MIQKRKGTIVHLLVIIFFKHPVSVTANSNILHNHCPGKMYQTERGKEKLNDIV